MAHMFGPQDFLCVQGGKCGGWLSYVIEKKRRIGVGSTLFIFNWLKFFFFPLYVHFTFESVSFNREVFMHGSRSTYFRYASSNEVYASRD